MHKSEAHLRHRAILQIIPRLDAGGAEKTTLDIGNAVVFASGQSFVACDGGRLVPELVSNGTEFIQFPAATKNPLRIIRNGMKLAALIRKHKINILHARSRAPAWSALIASKITNIPFVTTYHGSYAGTHIFKIFYNSVMARGDVVIANSHYTASLIRTMHTFAKTRIRVIHRGTDMNAFSRESVSDERIDTLRDIWGTHGKRVVLLAARLTGWKGQSVLIDAMKIIVDHGITDCVAILAGDPQGRNDYVAELDTQIATLGLHDHVKRVGHCSDMPAAFALADLVTVPSTEPEAFGRSAVEAEAMQTPVIVSDLGAVPETVLSPPDCSAEDRTGWRIPPHDAKALAEAMMEALALSPSERADLGRRARAHVVENFSLERMTGDTIAIYREILSKTEKKQD